MVLRLGVEAGWGRSSPSSQKMSTRQDPARSPRAPRGQHEATNPLGSGTQVGIGLLPDGLCPPLDDVWGRARADGANRVSAAAPLQGTAPALTFPLLLTFPARVIRNLRVIFQSHDNSKCQPLAGSGAGGTGWMLCWGWGGPGDHRPEAGSFMGSESFPSKLRAKDCSGPFDFWGLSSPGQGEPCAGRLRSPHVVSETQ